MNNQKVTINIVQAILIILITFFTLKLLFQKEHFGGVMGKSSSEKATEKKKSPESPATPSTTSTTPTTPTTTTTTTTTANTPSPAVLQNQLINQAYNQLKQEMKNDICCSRVTNYTIPQIAACKHNNNDQKNCKDNFDSCIGSCLDSTRKGEILESIKKIQQCKSEISNYFYNSRNNNNPSSSDSSSPSPSSEHFTVSQSPSGNTQTSGPSSTSTGQGSTSGNTQTSGPSSTSTGQGSTSGNTQTSIPVHCNKYLRDGPEQVSTLIRKDIFSHIKPYLKTTTVGCVNNFATVVQKKHNTCCIDKESCPLFLASELGLPLPNGNILPKHGVAPADCIAKLNNQQLEMCSLVQAQTSGPTPSQGTGSGNTAGQGTGSVSNTGQGTASTTSLSTTGNTLISTKTINGYLPKDPNSIDFDVSNFSEIVDLDIASAKVNGADITNNINPTILKQNMGAWLIYVYNDNSKLLKLIQIQSQFVGQEKIKFKVMGAGYLQIDNFDPNNIATYMQTGPTAVSVATNDNGSGYGVYDLVIKITGEKDNS